MFNRSKVWAFGFLVATFVAGLVVGGGAERMLNAREDGSSSERHRGRRGWVERLTTELNLTPAQQDSVRAIVDRSKPAMGALWKSIRPSFDSMRAAINTNISAQLNDEQQAKFAEILQRAERRWRHGNGKNKSHGSDTNETKN